MTQRDLYASLLWTLLLSGLSIPLLWQIAKKEDFDNYKQRIDAGWFYPNSTFTRKNHLYVTIIPLNVSHRSVITDRLPFQKQTFSAGLTTSSSLHTLAVASGYQLGWRLVVKNDRDRIGLRLVQKGTVVGLQASS